MQRLLNHSIRINVFFILVWVFISQIYGQTSVPRKPEYGQFDDEELEQKYKSTTVDLRMEVPALEKTIDPDTYIIGAGDEIGVDVISSANLTYVLRVNPAGDVLIPSGGIIKVAGLTFNAAMEEIQKTVYASYKNAIVHATLLNVRNIKIQVVGAVRRPGFVIVTPLDRVTDAIEQVDGLHKYADETQIKITKPNDLNLIISMKDYLLTGDLLDNPTLIEGDKIEVPFVADYQPYLNEIITLNATAIMVTGLVKFPGAFKYFSGYTINDYIGMAGGVLESGNLKKIEVLRLGKTIDIQNNGFIQPGDQIYVPKNFRSQLLGTSSILQTVTAMATLYLSYIAATKNVTKK